MNFYIHIYMYVRINSIRSFDSFKLVYEYSLESSVIAFILAISMKFIRNMNNIKDMQRTVLINPLRMNFIV